MGEDTTQEFPQKSLAVILGRFDSLDSTMKSFELRLTALDEKVDRRLMETRPIWEGVLSRLDSVDVRLDSLEKRFDRVEEEFESLGLKFRTFQNDLLRMQTRDERLAERIEKLENPPAA
jgi:archaellum component FlaC